MHFREYPLLNTPNLMLVILREAEAGATSVEACARRLHRLLALTREEPPFAEDEILARLDALRRHLEAARMVAPADGDADGDGFTITPRGREALAEHPAGFDLADLMVYPEFADFIRRLARAREQMDPRTPAYDEGYSAYRSGARLAENPYNSDTVDHLAWENGWFEALDEDIT